MNVSRLRTIQNSVIGFECGMETPQEPVWSLYLIRLNSGELYTGITTDVERRLSEHQSGRGAKFLRGKKGLKLVFNTAIGDRSSALKLEAAIKKLPKQKKESLINGDFNIDILNAKYTGSFTMVLSTRIDHNRVDEIFSREALHNPAINHTGCYRVDADV